MSVRHAFAPVRLLPALLAAGAMLVSSQAFAHAHLKAATPAAESTVQNAPAALTLKFTEGLELKFSGVKVSGPGQADVAIGTATLDPKDDTLLNVPLPKTLAPGQYQVQWHAVATDGHKTNGTYRFTVQP
jgi:methionine-rich copper-binding protein CopC